MFTKENPFVLFFKGRLEKEAFLAHSLVSLIFYYVGWTPKLSQSCYVKNCAIFIILKHRNLFTYQGIFPLKMHETKHHQLIREGYYVLDTCPRPRATTTTVVAAGHTSWFEHQDMYTRQCIYCPQPP